MDKTERTQNDPFEVVKVAPRTQPACQYEENIHSSLPQYQAQTTDNQDVIDWHNETSSWHTIEREKMLIFKRNLGGGGGRHQAVSKNDYRGDTYRTSRYLSGEQNQTSQWEEADNFPESYQQRERRPCVCKPTDPSYEARRDQQRERRKCQCRPAEYKYERQEPSRDPYQEERRELVTKRQEPSRDPYQEERREHRYEPDAEPRREHGTARRKCQCKPTGPRYEFEKYLNYKEPRNQNKNECCTLPTCSRRKPPSTNTPILYPTTLPDPRGDNDEPVVDYTEKPFIITPYNATSTETRQNAQTRCCMNCSCEQCGSESDPEPTPYKESCPKPGIKHCREEARPEHNKPRQEYQEQRARSRSQSRSRSEQPDRTRYETATRSCAACCEYKSEKLGYEQSPKISEKPSPRKLREPEPFCEPCSQPNAKPCYDFPPKIMPKKKPETRKLREPEPFCEPCSQPNAKPCYEFPPKIMPKQKPESKQFCEPCSQPNAKPCYEFPPQNMPNSIKNTKKQKPESENICSPCEISDNEDYNDFKEKTDQNSRVCKSQTFVTQSMSCAENCTRRPDKRFQKRSGSRSPEKINQQATKNPDFSFRERPVHYAELPRKSGRFLRNPLTVSRCSCNMQPREEFEAPKKKKKQHSIPEYCQPLNAGCETVWQTNSNNGFHNYQMTANQVTSCCTPSFTNIKNNAERTCFVPQTCFDDPNQLKNQTRSRFDFTARRTIALMNNCPRPRGFPSFVPTKCCSSRRRLSGCEIPSLTSSTWALNSKSRPMYSSKIFSELSIKTPGFAKYQKTCRLPKLNPGFAAHHCIISTISLRCRGGKINTANRQKHSKNTKYKLRDNTSIGATSRQSNRTQMSTIKRARSQSQTSRALPRSHSRLKIPSGRRQQQYQIQRETRVLPSSPQSSGYLYRNVAKKLTDRRIPLARKQYQPQTSEQTTQVNSCERHNQRIAHSNCSCFLCNSKTVPQWPAPRPSASPAVAELATKKARNWRENRSNWSVENANKGAHFYGGSYLTVSAVNNMTDVGALTFRAEKVRDRTLIQMAQDKFTPKLFKARTSSFVVPNQWQVAHDCNSFGAPKAIVDLRQVDIAEPSTSTKSSSWSWRKLCPNWLLHINKSKATTA